MTARPESFMYVSGTASVTRRPADAHLVDAAPRSLPFFSVVAVTRARISTISAPTLWRVCAYSSPGLPSPTTRRSAGVP